MIIGLKFEALQFYIGVYFAQDYFFPSCKNISFHFLYT